MQNFKKVMAVLPFIVSMYFLYFLEKAEIWLPEMPHRDKITIVVLILGMGISFYLLSAIKKK